METGAGAAPAAGVDTSNAGGTEGGSTDSAVEAAPAGQSQATNPTKAELKELAQESLDQLVTVKVNGQTRKVTVREALKQAELGAGAQMKMQEAAKERKEAQRLRQLAKEDPDAFFKETGVDPDEYAERRLVRKYERMAETPEQRQLREREERLQQYEKRDSQTKQGLLTQLRDIVGEVPKELEGKSPEEIHYHLERAKEAYQHQVSQIEKEFVEAWTDTGLPKDPMFGQWTASLMHASQVQKNAGQREEALQAKEAAHIVKESFLSAVQRITEAMTPEQVTQLLGAQKMKQLREFDVQRVTGQRQAPTQERPNSPGQKPASSRSNKVTVNDQGWNSFFRNIK